MNSGEDSLRTMSNNYVEMLRAARAAANAAVEGRKIELLAHGVYNVPSERIPGAYYQVLRENEVWVCTCEDFRARRKHCKHIGEVLLRFYPDEVPPTRRMPNATDYYSDARRFLRLPFEYDDGPAEATRRDRALIISDVRVEELLCDVASTMNAGSKVPYGPGRRTLPPGDKVLVAIMRAQHRKSMRKAQPIFARLQAEGKIAFAPSKGSLVKYNSDPAMIRLLEDAFVLTTRPFVALEQDIIIDSSGISPQYVSNWRLSDRGSMNIQDGTSWFKMHIAMGRESNAILGFALTEHKGEGTSDHANLKPLVESIARRGFDLRYVIADNAYLSLENRDHCEAIGATLIGPVKPRNYGKGRKPTEAIRHIEAIRLKNPELYDELCRARQPIEGLFSLEKRLDIRIAGIGTLAEREAWKKGSGDSLFVSRRNEFITRVIRHNLRCTVIEEQLRNRSVSYQRGSFLSHVRDVAH